MNTAKQDLISDPTSRNLRIYAFDPSISSTLDTTQIGEITVPVRWEDLEPGPVGEYLEVVDVDPSSRVFYKPVDLNDPRVLAQNGLAPSETNPQFHQQMVYAVAMTTIRHFEQALGRVALWSSARDEDGEFVERYVQRLRIYPHALRDRNAYYSPKKKALLFGYFPVGKKDADNTPGTIVHSCLSHDIVAHETTHALLDGVHPRFNEPMNADVLAFHEAFADIVALFQHFSYPGVLKDQISRTRGNLAGENLLAQLAQQFGKAAGRGSSLRDALGQVNPKTKKWEARKPDVHSLENAFEPHERGSVLVAAVFGAFLGVYKTRTADLYRIATEGTGVLKDGDIHPDLANRLASEAARCAQQVLQMCIRALDYCPPVGITFGDYLRAIVTADYDLNPDDPDNYRLSFVENFRRWGISPRGMLSMSVESLLWPTGADLEQDMEASKLPDLEDAELEQLIERSQSILSSAVKALFTGTQSPASVPPGGSASKTAAAQNSATNAAGQGASDQPSDNPKRPKQPKEPKLSWDLESNRRDTWNAIDGPCQIMWHWLILGEGQQFLSAFGLVAEPVPGKNTVYRSKSRPQEFAVSVQSVRSALRRSPRGGSQQVLVVEVTQRRRGYFDEERQKKMDSCTVLLPREQNGDFKFRSGCTLLIDPKTMEVRRVIRNSGNITDDEALNEMRRYLTEKLRRANAFNGIDKVLYAKEPFALLHNEESKRNGN